MSGGHWSYFGRTINDCRELTASAMEMLADVERMLDWGHAGDTCLDCARLRAIATLEAFFDEKSGAGHKPWAMAEQDVYCEVCKSSRATGSSNPAE